MNLLDHIGFESNEGPVFLLWCKHCKSWCDGNSCVEAAATFWRNKCFVETVVSSLLTLLNVWYMSLR